MSGGKLEVKKQTYNQITRLLSLVPEEKMPASDDSWQVVESKKAKIKSEVSPTTPNVELSVLIKVINSPKHFPTYRADLTGQQLSGKDCLSNILNILRSINRHYRVGHADQLHQPQLSLFISHLLNQFVLALNQLPRTEVDVNESVYQTQSLCNVLHLLLDRKLLRNTTSTSETPRISIQLEGLLSALASRLKDQSGQLEEGLECRRLFALINLLQKEQLIAPASIGRIVEAIAELGMSGVLVGKGARAEFITQWLNKQPLQQRLQLAPSIFSGLGLLARTNKLEPLPAEQINQLLHDIARKLKDQAKIPEGLSAAHLYKILDGITDLAIKMKIRPIDSLAFEQMMTVFSWLLHNNSGLKELNAALTAITNTLDCLQCTTRKMLQLLDDTLEALRVQSKKIVKKDMQHSIRHIVNMLMRMSKTVKTHKLYGQIPSTQLPEHVDQLLSFLLEAGKDLSTNREYICSVVYALRARVLMGISKPTKTSEKLAEIAQSYLLKSKDKFTKTEYPKVMNQFAWYRYFALPPKEKLPESIQQALNDRKTPLDRLQKSLETDLPDHGFTNIKFEKPIGYLKTDVYGEVVRLIKGKRRVIKIILEIDGPSHYTPEGRLKDWFRDHALYFKAANEFDILIHYPVHPGLHYTAGMLIKTMQDAADKFDPIPERKEKSQELYEYIVEKEQGLKVSNQPPVASPLALKKQSNSASDELLNSSLPVPAPEDLGPSLDIKEPVKVGKITQAPAEASLSSHSTATTASSVTPSTMTKPSQSPKPKLTERQKHKIRKSKAKSQKPVVAEKTSNEHKPIAQDSTFFMTEEFSRLNESNDFNLDTITRGAKAGNPQCQYILAMDYFQIKKDREKGFLWCQRAAIQGNVNAQYVLGGLYYEGRGVEKDLTKAVEWFTKAAEQNHPISQYNLSALYRQGQGVDLNKAFYWCKKAAVAGHAPAQFDLGKDYECGVGKDIKNAVRWYRKAAKSGNDASAQNSLAVCYEQGKGVSKDILKAIKLYKKAAKSSNAAAQYNLGRCHELGIGVGRNLQKAMQCFRKAQHKIVEAQFRLGECYENSQGTKQDLKEAVVWYRKAAEKGHVLAQLNLGQCCEKAQGTEKDMVEAVKWYEKAADQGNTRAKYNLGKCYIDGNGVKKNEAKGEVLFQEAAAQGDIDVLACLQLNSGHMQMPEVSNELIKWQKAANEGDSDAQYNLGLYHSLGKGGKKDFKEALRWYEKAAENSYIQAQCALALLYQQGAEGVEKNPAEAVRWYKIAADKGDAYAQVKMADYYREGMSGLVKKDEKQAREYYKRAAFQNRPIAQYNLALCFAEGIGGEKDRKQAIKWCKEAAESNYPLAQLLLAIYCCSSEGGLEPDLEEAIKWCTKAQENGVEDADELLARLQTQKLSPRRR